MISSTLKMLILIALGCYLVVLLIFLKNRTIALKYTLLWLLGGLILLIFVLFPALLYRLTELIGMGLPSNLLFMTGIGCILMILMGMTAIVSKQKNDIKRLTQELAQMEKRIRDLETGGAE